MYLIRSIYNGLNNLSLLQFHPTALIEDHPHGQGSLELSPQETGREGPLTPSWLKVPVEMVSQVCQGEVNAVHWVCAFSDKRLQSQIEETPPHPRNPLPLQRGYLVLGVRLCNLLL